MKKQRISNKQGTLEHRDMLVAHLAASDERTVCGVKIAWKLHRSSGRVSRVTQITRDANYRHLCRRCKASVS